MKEEIFKTNSYYEGLIQNLYGGSKGCFSAFMHFFYQYNQSVLYFSEYEDCFKEIYLKELENCHILAQTILKMGGDNKYYGSSKKFLSGNNVDYIKNFEKIFLYDIELLEMGVLETKNIILKVDNVAIKKELKLVLENKQQCLKKLKENYFKNKIL